MSTIWKRPFDGMRRRSVAIALATGFGLCAILCLTVYAASEARLRHRYDVAVAPLAVPHDPATIARGEHVVRAVAKCTGCHADDLGGRVVTETPLIGRLSAPNLTVANIAARTDEDLVRALTHGVAPDGRPLVLMPSHEIAELAPDDLAAVLAYLRTVPPVRREVPPLRVGPLLRVLLIANKVPLLSAERIDHSRAPAKAPKLEANAEYGEYLAKAGGCFGCHGPSLAGGAIPGMPPDAPHAADLRARALASWSYADFERALRNGVRPDGRRLAELMPWRATRNLTDLEMRALFAYLKSGDAGVRAASNP